MYLTFDINDKTDGGYIAESGQYQIAVHPLDYLCGIYLRKQVGSRVNWFRTEFAYTFIVQDNVIRFLPSSETMLWNTNIRVSIYLVQAVEFMCTYYSLPMNLGGAR